MKLLIQYMKTKTMDYSNFTQATQTYMLAVERFLKEKYGKISKEWYQSLYQIAQLKDIIEECAASIKEHGAVTVNRYGGLVSNPSIKDYTSCSKTLLLLQKEFGINPASLARLDKMTTTDEKEDNIDDAARELIDAII